MAPEIAGPPRWFGGPHAVGEILRVRPGDVQELCVAQDSERESPRIGKLIVLARSRGLRVRFARPGELDRLCPEGHQGVAALARERRVQGLDAYLAGLDEASRREAVIVALDCIQDPHNLGAIARSAANLGAAGLLVPDRRSAHSSPAAVRASAGALERIPVFTVVNLAQALARFREAGFWVYGADMEGRPAWEVELKPPFVLVIGSEGEGLRALVKKSCDALLTIPQAAAGVASLNASCAASVLLYEVRRQAAMPSGGA